MSADLQRTFLGLDFSTQQLKAVLTDFDLNVIAVYSVQFDTDLPEFHTDGGVHKEKDGHTVTAPPLMWVSALDLLLSRMKSNGVDFSRVLAISGAGQQHGSVYWKKGTRQILHSLKSNQTLATQLKDCFATNASPIWMDSSTGLQCQQLEQVVGGPMALCKLTGSKAYHRFTGNQISKIFHTAPLIYNDTEKISLVSSFACSLFLGDYAPIDYADGSGMNLFTVNSKCLEPILLEQCGGPDLANKLGTLIPAKTIVGSTSSYFVEKYGFSPDCSIIAFTGDNPASMAGMNLQPNDIAISLGTSDTVIAWLHSWAPTLNAHVFCNPLDENEFMGLLCFKNGSLTRERIRKNCGCEDWNSFNELLRKTKPGNDGNIGFYFDFPEILPNVKAGDRRFNKTGQEVCSFEPAVEARAVIEHQCLAKRLHTESLSSMKGQGSKSYNKVLVTGGASNNPLILKSIADVFNSKVYVQDVAHSAALGCAYRAKHAIMPENISFTEVCQSAVQLTLVAEPDPTAANVYQSLLQRYKLLEMKLVQEQDNS